MSKSEVPQQNRTTFTLTLAPEHLERLRVLMRQCGIATEKDLVNNALTTFEWVVAMVASGKPVAAVDLENRTYQEFSIPALNAVRPQKH